MYVVSSLEEKQKAYVVVSVVEHLLTQVSWPANTWEKKDRQNSVHIFLGVNEVYESSTRTRLFPKGGPQTMGIKLAWR